MYAKRPQTHTCPHHLFVCVLFCFREVEFVSFFSKQGFLCVALAVLELTEVVFCLPNNFRKFFLLFLFYFILSFRTLKNHKQARWQQHPPKFNPSTQWAEAGIFLLVQGQPVYRVSLRPAGDTQRKPVAKKSNKTKTTTTKES